MRAFVLTVAFACLGASAVLADTTATPNTNNIVTFTVQDTANVPVTDPLTAEIAEIMSTVSGMKYAEEDVPRFLNDLTTQAADKCQSDAANDGEEDSFGSTACIASVQMASDDWQLREAQHATVVAIELQRLRIAKAVAETAAAKAEQTAREAELVNMNAAAALTAQSDLAALRTFTAELIAEAVANCSHEKHDEPRLAICDEPTTHLGIAAANEDGSIDWQLIAIDDQ